MIFPIKDAEETTVVIVYSNEVGQPKKYEQKANKATLQYSLPEEG